MMGTGFMKCIPSTLSGRFVAAPSRVIEIDEVFEASTLSAADQAVERAEQRFLGVDILDDRFDDEVGRHQPVEAGAHGQPSQRRVAIGGRQPPFLDELRQAAFHAAAGTIEHRLRHVDEPDVETRLGKRLGYSAAHRPSAHHTHSFHGH